MDLSTDVAVPHPTPRYDGDGIQVVVYTVKVPIHLHKKSVKWDMAKYHVARLGIEPTSPRRVPDSWSSIGDPLYGD